MTRSWFALLALCCVAACTAIDVDPNQSVGPSEVDHPVGWYPLDDPHAIGRDRSGFGRDALAFGISLVNDSRRGEAAQFAAGSLVIATPLENDLTVALWFQTSTPGPDQQGWVDGPRILDADVAGSRADFGISLALDKLALGVGDPNDAAIDGTSLKSQRTVVDGTWHHVAVTREGSSGTWRLFIDGTVDGTEVGVSGALTLPKTITFGGVGNTTPVSPPLYATLSDILLYDRVLGAAGIAFLATQ